MDTARTCRQCKKVLKSHERYGMYEDMCKSCFTESSPNRPQQASRPVTLDKPISRIKPKSELRKLSDSLKALLGIIIGIGFGAVIFIGSALAAGLAIIEAIIYAGSFCLGIWSMFKIDASNLDKRASLILFLSVWISVVTIMVITINFFH